ncbi:hypothetical protein AAG570_006272 [Ranatra chinensis]|uniref:Protein pinocchio n=1 Tax=Ranatra chinensis TaxID=642074 RepID=A0ABD0YTL5_9HEMI
MSVASVRPVGGGLANRSQSYNSVSSLDEVSAGSYLTPETTVLSIEELRLQLNSCFTCGVSWQDDHVSLDCAECGGYSLERPCPICEGHCSAVWKRDLTMQGTCAMRDQSEPAMLLLKPLASEEESHLCSRIEKLAASS